MEMFWLPCFLTLTGTLTQFGKTLNCWPFFRFHHTYMLKELLKEHGHLTCSCFLVITGHNCLQLLTVSVVDSCGFSGRLALHGRRKCFTAVLLWIPQLFCKRPALLFFLIGRQSMANNHADSNTKQSLPCCQFMCVNMSVNGCLFPHKRLQTMDG